MILSDLGARVIKIEAPEIGDDSRKFGPFIKDYSAYFMSLNRGKESIALNLKNEEDKKIKSIPGASGLSPTRSSIIKENAWDWATNIWEDMLS